MTRSNRPPAQESLAHSLQKRPRLRMDADARSNPAPQVETLLREAESYIAAAQEIYLVDDAILDLAEHRISTVLTDHSQKDAIHHVCGIVGKINSIVVIESRRGDLRQCVMIVPSRPEYESALPGLQGLTRFYSIGEVVEGGEKNAVLANAVVSFDPFAPENRLKETIGESFAVSALAPVTPEQSRFLAGTALNVLSVLHMLQRQVDYVLPEKKHFGSENQVRRVRKKPLFSPVTTLRIDEAHEAVITYHREKAAAEVTQRRHTSPTYDRPFIVRPKEKIAHAKAGTPEERKRLNAALKSGDAEQLERLLIDFNSPQARRPLVARVTLGHGQRRPKGVAPGGEE